MKTLILYDTRHGFTQKCVDLLVGELPPGSELWSLKNLPGMPDWSQYDAIVLGGPVYFGRWSGRLRGFLKRQGQALVDAKVPLAAFVVSLSPRAAALRYFTQALPQGWAGQVKHVACFGGGITWKALTWWEKMILKRGHHIQTDASNLDLGEIQALALWVGTKASSGTSA